MKFTLVCHKAVVVLRFVRTPYSRDFEVVNRFDFAPPRPYAHISIFVVE